MYSSPNAPDLELDMMATFGRPGGIDVSGAYYGAFPTPNAYEDLTSPMSAKRSRDGFDEILSDTLGAFALESKKKRLDSTYNEGIHDFLEDVIILIVCTETNLTLFFPFSFILTFRYDGPLECFVCHLGG